MRIYFLGNLTIIIEIIINLSFNRYPPNKFMNISLHILQNILNFLLNSYPAKTYFVLKAALICCSCFKVMMHPSI